MDVDVTSRLSWYRSVCGLSRYASSIIKVGGGGDIDMYGRQLLDLLRSNRYDYFLPVGLESYLASSRLRTEICREVACLIPRWESMEVAYNKDRAMDLARSLKVPIPETMVLEGQWDISRIISYPVVLKSSEPGSVRYCNSAEEAQREYQLLSRSSRTKVMSQEMISGHGCGFYAVYYEGQLMDFFLHRRVREFPLTGGASAVAESYRSRRLFELGKTIGDALEWNGPLMVEFKYDLRSEDYRLMEINPKLWGSLDLTMAAGVDVPGLIFGLADGTIQRPVASIYEEAHYRDVRYRWPFPDQFKVFCSRPSIELGGELLKGDGESNLILNDPIPNLFMIGSGILEGLGILIDENRRYPHGRRTGV
jgi:predicted ATP-grasp superfamily ATP-dependent carboligase